MKVNITIDFIEEATGQETSSCSVIPAHISQDADVFTRLYGSLYDIRFQELYGAEDPDVVLLKVLLDAALGKQPQSDLVKSLFSDYRRFHGVKVPDGNMMDDLSSIRDFVKTLSNRLIKRLQESICDKHKVEGD